MMNKKIIAGFLIFFIVGFAEKSQGQTGDGGTISIFSTTGVQARALGLGMATVAFPEDPSAIFWNPGAMGVVQKKSLSLSMSTLIEGVNQQYIAWVFPTVFSGAFGISVSRIGVDGIMETSWSPGGIVEQHGTFGYWQGKATLAYSLPLFKQLHVGVGFDIIRQVLGTESSNGFGLNGGILYSHPAERGLLSHLTLGVVVENMISPRLNLGEEAENIPWLIRAGIAKQYLFRDGQDRWMFLIDMEKSPWRETRLRFGTEFTWNHLIFLRAGLNHRFPAFGFGLRYKNIQIDYGSGQMNEFGYHPMLHRFSVVFSMGKGIAERREDLIRKREKDIEQAYIAQMESDRQERIDTALELGKHYLASSNYFNARLYISRVLQEDSEHSEARKLMDEISLKEDEYQKKRETELVTERLRRQEVQRDSLFIEEKREAASNAIRNEDFKNAVAAFEAILEKDSNNQQIIAYLEQARSRQREKITELIQASRNLIRQEAISEARARLNTAKAQAEGIPEYENQVEREIVRLDREVDFIHNYQEGRRRFDRRDYEGASAFLRRALANKPDHNHSAEMLQIANARLTGSGDVLEGEALEKFQEGVRLYTQGDYEKALAIWNEALKMAPDNVTLLRALQALRIKMDELRNDR